MASLARRERFRRSAVPPLIQTDRPGVMLYLSSDLSDLTRLRWRLWSAAQTPPFPAAGSVCQRASADGVMKLSAEESSSDSGCLGCEVFLFGCVDQSESSRLSVLT